MRIDLLSFVVAGVIVAQSPPKTQTPRPAESTVQVRGCLQGQTLTVTEDPGFVTPAGRIDLKGDRRLMRTLKEHNGHLEEIVGVLKTQSRDTAVMTKEKRGEKGRVYVGVSEDRSKTVEAATPAPVLEVRAFSHIAAKCK